VNSGAWNARGQDAPTPAPRADATWAPHAALARAYKNGLTHRRRTRTRHLASHTRCLPACGTSRAAHARMAANAGTVTTRHYRQVTRKLACDSRASSPAYCRLFSPLNLSFLSYYHYLSSSSSPLLYLPPLLPPTCHPRPLFLPRCTISALPSYLSRAFYNSTLHAMGRAGNVAHHSLPGVLYLPTSPRVAALTWFVCNIVARQVTYRNGCGMAWHTQMFAVKHARHMCAEVALDEAATHKLDSSCRRNAWAGA